MVYKIGTFLGAQYLKTRYNDFENFLYEIIKDLKLLSEINIESKKNNSILWRFGTSSNKNLLFILNPEEKTEIKITIPENLLKGQKSITSINTIKPIKLTTEKNKNFFSITVDKNSWDIYFW